MTTATLDLTVIFLDQVLDLVHSDPSFETLKTLRDKLKNRDPSALDILKTLSEDPYMAPYTESDVYETLREELGASISNDAECIHALESYKVYTTNPEVISVLDRAIAFLRIPNGEEFDFEDMPIVDMAGILEEFPGNSEFLAECIRYISTAFEE